MNSFQFEQCKPVGEECTIGGGPKASCCDDLKCKRSGGGGGLGGMGVCEKPKDGDTYGEDEAKVRTKVYL